MMLISGDNPLLNLTPHLFGRGTFQPIEGGALTVMLPGEQISSIVHKVVTENQAIVEIAAKPFGLANHHYKIGDLVAVVRTPNAIGGKDWVALAEPPPASVMPSSRVAGAAPPLLPRSIDPALAPVIAVPPQLIRE